jgi:plastocyanin
MKFKSMSKIGPISDGQTALAVLAVVLSISALSAVGCGGSGGSYSSASPTTPSTTAAAAVPAAATTPAATSAASTPAGAVTVNIVGLAGSGAFSPNPVQASSGTSILWKNATSEAHHIVMDDGTLIGDIAPGASLTKPLSGSGGNYHCTIHPTMVGSINGAAAPPDPTPSSTGTGYDY